VERQAADIGSARGVALFNKEPCDAARRYFGGNLDVASAIEKIRRVAAYCRGKMVSESQSPGYDGRREKG